MMVRIDAGKCDYCGTCASVCACDAVDVGAESISVNERCTDCEICIKACPAGLGPNITAKTEERKPAGDNIPSVLNYDAVVVGAGPGGSLAAKTIADEGLKVLLIERNREVGVPLRCAEGVSKTDLLKFTEPDKKWISAETKGVKVFAPDMTGIVVEEEGYVLERRVFDKVLAKNAAKSGADVLTGACATGVLKNGARIKGIKMHVAGENYEVYSKVVIGADGIASCIGKWAGIDTTLRLFDVEACAQFLISDIEVDEDYYEIYLNNRIAPGGYAWVFPKGRRRANVGLGILASRASGAVDYLRRFVSKKFPDGRIVSTMIGGVPVSAPIERTVCDGLILVGDAARQTDPLSGGGIVNAMHAGKMAGEVCARAIRNGDVSAAALGEYERIWRETIGKTNERLYRIKELFVSLRDEDINESAHHYASEKERMGQIFEMFRGRV